MRVRPSALYDVSPKYAAWCFDRAVETFGKTLEDKLRTAVQGAKDQARGERAALRVLDKWLSSADPARVDGEIDASRFRDPFATVG